MNKHILYLDEPASEWELASPVGCGSMGAMVFGGVTRERIQLSEESIWAGGKIDAVREDFRDKIEKIRELLLEGHAPAADEYATEALKDSFFRIKSQETAGDLFIDFGCDDSCENYRRELDLLNGVSTVSFERGGEKYCRETFASYPKRIIAARHTGSHSAKISYVRSANAVKLPVPENDDPRVGVKSVRAEDGELLINAAPAVGGTEFWVRVKVKTDGELTSNGECIVVTGATNTEYYISVGVGYIPELPDCDYDSLKKEATDDFASLMGRSDITLHGEGSDELDALPVNRRIERLIADESLCDAGLVALYFEFGKYLLVGSSRRGTLPANLQGVWNGYINAPWNNDYHTNINLQMNYWHAEVANLAECAEPLFDYMNKYLLESGRETARVNYRCRGTVLHHLSDIYGFTAPADGLWGLWPLGGAWLCLNMWEHYLYSGDKDYLRSVAYEYIRDSARFFLDYMFEDKDGRLLSGPSTSPENRYFCEGKPSFLCLSPTMDIEIIGCLLRMYIETEELLGINPDWADEARAALGKMPPLKIGKHGQLMEWMEDWDEPEPGHRHISHMFALYPDCAISDETPELYAAARKTLERRLANGGGHTGWSCAWLICLFARLHDADGAAAMIHKLFAHSTRTNMFDSHPPFQIDGNFGASAGIAELLMQSHNGCISLLPACPKEFESGSFTRLMARGGVEVSAEFKDGKVISGKLYARRAYTGKLIYNGTERELKLAAGETYEF